MEQHYQPVQNQLESKMMFQKNGSPRDLYMMTLISSSRGERKSNQNLASFMGAPRSIVVCVLVLHMHDHFTVKLDNLPESSDARASPWSSLRCIYGIFESIFFRMTGRFNGPFVEILVSAIIGASWLLTANIFESGLMVTPWKFSAGPPMLPSCKLD